MKARAAALGGDETERCAALTKDTKNHKDTQRKATQEEPQISQIWADLGPATAGRTRNGSLEVWRLGGLAFSARRPLPSPRVCGFAAARSVLRFPFSGARQRPLSYMSYRNVFWHVADVPGVQGQLEAWKLGGLAFSVGLRHTTFVTSTGRLLYLLYTVWREMFTEQ